jgi:hypothetical protein
MDETEFQIGVGRKHKVITRMTTKRQYQSDLDNRDYITSIEYISAAGAIVERTVQKGRCEQRARVKPKSVT